MTRPFPFETSIFGGHYATGIEAGWFALEDTEKGGGILFTFPPDLCRWLWLWLVYGGWRGYYHAIIEPWTSYPVHLGEAVKQGTSRKLEPGETFAAEARAAPFEPGETPRDALARALR